MKKNECNYCKNNQDHPCIVCGGLCHESSRETFHSTLYAAEFLLYAFHFEDRKEGNVSQPAAAHPLMMLVAEG
jgi:hypothetical protein